MPARRCALRCSRPCASGSRRPARRSPTTPRGGASSRSAPASRSPSGSPPDSPARRGTGGGVSGPSRRYARRHAAADHRLAVSSTLEIRGGIPAGLRPCQAAPATTWRRTYPREEPLMKPAPFDYLAPHSLAAALGALDEDAKALAGGQSLVPLLNFRLARPERVVDLNGVDELAYLRKSDGTLRIGAMTRQAVVERSGVVAVHWPLLTRAVKNVAHPAIRNRGTVGGSLAHADPAAELPVAMCALDARLHVRSAQRGERTIAATHL